MTEPEVASMTLAALALSGVAVGPSEIPCTPPTKNDVRLSRRRRAAAMRDAGFVFREIALAFGVTTERARQMTMAGAARDA